MGRLKRKLALAAASMIAVTGGVAAVAESPAYALATCPQFHVCFYEDFKDNNGNPSPAGTMSDQTEALTRHPQQVRYDDSSGQEDMWTAGKISNFKNSHYTNGDGLNDSVSFIVNNTGSCLWMWGDSDFQIPNMHAHEGVFFGPHTGKAMVGSALGDENNKFSSAAVSTCGLPNGKYNLLTDIIANIGPR
jgi:hypothetical protein